MENGPLLDLVKKGTKWKWEQRHTDAFQRLKGLFDESAFLTYPRRDIPYVLQTDASLKALGAFLGQRNQDDDLQAVQLASRVLKGSERNYFVTELELLAIVWALHKFRLYLIGAKIRIETDHKALSFLLTCRFTNARLIRWMLVIQDYDIEIRYIKGSDNKVADALSRITEHITRIDERMLVAISYLRQPEEKFISKLKHIKQQQDLNEQLREIKEDVSKGKLYRGFSLHDGMLIKGKEGYQRVVLTKQLAEQLIRETHELYGHTGARKCFQMINEHFYFPKLRRAVAAIIRTCDSCQRNKVYTQNNHHESSPIIANSVNETISVDFFGPLPVSRAGVRYIFSVIDLFQVRHLISYEKSKHRCMYQTNF